MKKFQFLRAVLEIFWAKLGGILAQKTFSQAKFGHFQSTWATLRSTVSQYKLPKAQKWGKNTLLFSRN